MEGLTRAENKIHVGCYIDKHGDEDECNWIDNSKTNKSLVSDEIWNTDFFNFEKEDVEWKNGVMECEGKWIAYLKAEFTKEEFYERKPSAY